MRHIFKRCWPLVLVALFITVCTACGNSPVPQDQNQEPALGVETTPPAAQAPAPAYPPDAAIAKDKAELAQLRANLAEITRYTNAPAVNIKWYSEVGGAGEDICTAGIRNREARLMKLWLMDSRSHEDSLGITAAAAGGLQKQVAIKTAKEIFSIPNKALAALSCEMTPFDLMQDAIEGMRHAGADPEKEAGLGAKEVRAKLGYALGLQIKECLKEPSADRCVPCQDELKRTDYTAAELGLTTAEYQKFAKLDYDAHG